MEHSSTSRSGSPHTAIRKVQFFLVSLFLALAGCSGNGVDETRPNVIFIMADDMGYGDISGLNPESKIRTPVLDRMIEEGRHFTEAHTSASLCSPTRYALLTGRYSFRTGKRGVATGYSEPWIKRGRETLGTLFQKAGYSTAIIGKWHLGLEWQPKDTTKPIFTRNEWIPENLNVDYTKKVGGVNEVGFDYSYISAAGNNLAPFTFIENGDLLEVPSEFVEPKIDGHTYRTRRNGGDIAPDYAFDKTLENMTHKVLDYIEDRSQSRLPFFLYVPLTAPHFPWSVHPSFRGSSSAGLYGDFIKEIDARVGQILQELRQKNLEEKTLMIFTADNGGVSEHWFIKKYKHLMNIGRRGEKGDIWEGGVRVPFIAQWKGVIEAGSKTDKPISLVDMLATFSGIIDEPLHPKYGEDSFDLSGTLLGKEEQKDRGAMINQTGDPDSLSITWNGWKLIPANLDSSGQASVGGGKGMLFNLRDDPMEHRNLYESHPEIVRELSGKLGEFMDSGYSRTKKSGK